LPGLEFGNQGSSRLPQELVFGEEDPNRATPPTSTTFRGCPSQLFPLYLNFMYFNIGRIIYLQTDDIFPYILLGPTIVTGKITLGAMNQILNAFSQVRSSFQYLVNSWSTIVELISIYKRLHAFEARIEGRSLVSIVKEEEAEEASLPRPRLNDAGLLAPVVLSEGRI
jgi:peptide/bleomycin uptake transporter